MIPRATYRIQFHKDFTFADAAPLVPYLAKLGVSHLYASPIGTARAGSNHGYDVVDPMTINPELGGEEGFRALAAACKTAGLGIILDIVPNHLAVGKGDNAWWLDLLAHGESGRYADWFDVDWHPGDPALDGKVYAPFLGAPYAEVLRSGDLKVEQVDGGGLAVTAYGEHVFPLRDEDQGIEPGDYATPEALHELCERQHWRLAWWRTAGDRINWRRFFDITELAGIRVEKAEVFDAVHALPLKLYAQGLIDGVRVDHVDGLADPAGYCRRLRDKLESAGEWRPTDAAPGPAYIVVEKILGEGERLNPEWMTDGTSGYDFMNTVATLLHDPSAASGLGELWHEISGRPAEFAPEELAARREMLANGFAGQWDACANAFFKVAQSDLATSDIAKPALRRAIGDLICGFNAYRTYGTGDAAPALDATIRDPAVAKGRELASPADADLVTRVGDWLAGEGPGDVDLRREAVRQFQQLSAPIAAKAVEDTAFYRYGRLLSANNVGFDPDHLGSRAAWFARAIEQRAGDHPNAMLATATHDHKRGEDVQMRLSIITERPERWAAFAREWAGKVAQGVAPGDADMLHQTLVGAWPLDLDPDDADGMAKYAERIGQWWQKALREAKLRSSWTMPDEDYEAACQDYLETLLKPGSRFARAATALLVELAEPGAAKGLVQAALRCTVPGVPDCFQGREFWDFSLVDPDNRTPVDFPALERALDAGARDWRSGAAKQRLIADLLALRREHEALFRDGGFERIQLLGERAGQAIAFARVHDGARLTVLAAIRTADARAEGDDLVLPEDWWGDTALDDGRTAVEVAGRAVVAWRLDA
ncbi:malto-oligosyltrehalose synthase [Sphingomonas sp.]|uniref:malto-oligosyltrehalose synthase n=1 Tax=Sphingomonas sp. TaxID=28214 RepID=UPI003AFFEF01